MAKYRLFSHKLMWDTQIPYLCIPHRRPHRRCHLQKMKLLEHCGGLDDAATNLHNKREMAGHGQPQAASRFNY